MTKRDIYIGARVSEQEKRDIVESAKGMDITVSDFIRHRIIQPIMTIPEAVQNLKLYIDTKLSFQPYQTTNDQITNATSTKPEKPIIINNDPEKSAMQSVLIEFQEKVNKIFKKK